MKKIILIATVVMVFLTGAAFAKTHDVMLYIAPVEGSPIPEFYFEPTGLYIEPGDTVVFHALTPHHTVTSYHPLQGKTQRVPNGVEPFSSIVLPVGQSWSYTFTIPGVYDVWCAPHESYGMVMRIVVGEATGPGAVPSTDFSPDGTFGAAGFVLNDPALAPSRIIERGSVQWAEVRAAAAQANAEAPAH